MENEKKSRKTEGDGRFGDVPIARLQTEKKSDNDTQSLEEKDMGQALSAARPATSRPAILPNAWPMGLTFEQALAFTAVSPAQMRRWERDGRIVFQRVGRNGARVAFRPDLERLLEATFRGPVGIEEDFDFG